MLSRSYPQNTNLQIGIPNTRLLMNSMVGFPIQKRRERKEEKKPERETVVVVAAVAETAARLAKVAPLSVAEPRQPRAVAKPLSVAALLTVAQLSSSSPHLCPSRTSRRYKPLVSGLVSFAVPVGNDSSTLTTSLFKAGALNYFATDTESSKQIQGCCFTFRAGAKEPLLNLYKPKEPYTTTIVSVERVVGPKAPGETCHIVIDHDGNVPYWEGQSYGDLVYWTFGPVMLV
ncbi:hypothetical protein Q3G72_013320 [Acer saccharum]|nr:hypothetical protein Q3G72_013320 [Acer saccharum]